MKSINGNLYSRKAFEDYDHSITVIVETMGVDNTTAIHVYTTCSEREEVEEVIRNSKGSMVTSMKFTNWNTAEDDRRQSELIKETLRDI